MDDWKKYRRKGYAEMRPYIMGEDMTNISVSKPDQENSLENGMIARNPENHDDQWFVAFEYFRANYEEEGLPV